MSPMKFDNAARAEWDHRYMAAAARHRRQNELITADFEKALSRQAEIRNALQNSRKILEIGCGTGELSNWIARTFRQQVTGIDISGEAVQYASEYYGQMCRFYAADYQNLIDAGQQYDLIVSSHVLEHFVHYADVLHSWLKLAPLALLIVPYKEAKYADSYTEGGLRHNASLDEAALGDFEILNSFTFRSAAWQIGKDPLNWVALVKEKSG